jgi:hypothetical protein
MGDGNKHQKKIPPEGGRNDPSIVCKYELKKRKYISILTLNINDLNSSNKRHRIASWIKKTDLTICCLQETHLTDKKTNIGIEWKKILKANGPRKQDRVAIFIHYKMKISQIRQ